MHDVAIVGGGPVGVATAIALAQQNVDVVVLEQRTRPTEHSRAIGIHPPALELFEQWGCLERLLDAGLPIRRGEVRCGGAMLGRLSFEDAGGRFPYILSVPQYVTELVLRERLAEAAPRALVAGARVTGLDGVGGGIRVRTDGELSARWVIGADGAHGVTRSYFEAQEHPYPDRYVMADAAGDEESHGRVGHAGGAGAAGDSGSTVTADATTATNGTAEPHAPFAPDDAVLFFESGGVVESFPLPDGSRRWVVHLGRGSRADDVADDADAFACLVRERTGVDLDPARLTRPNAFGVRHAWTRPWDPQVLNGCLALVGDAAHEISPIGGQGMTLGWLNAADLADVLSRGAGEREMGAWASTAERRQRVAARQASFNTAMGRPRGPLPLALRNLLIRGIALPPLRARLARAFTMATPARLGS